MRRRTLATAVVVGLALAGCGSSGDDATVTTAATAPVTSGDAVTDLPVASAAAVMVPTADGSELDFNSLRNKDVLLWFWAPW